MKGTIDSDDIAGLARILSESACDVVNSRSTSNNKVQHFKRDSDYSSRQLVGSVGTTRVFKRHPLRPHRLARVEPPLGSLL
jgi:hypothetical protein